MTNLNELLLQLVDGQALPLLQDGELGLLSIRGLVAPKGVFLPLGDVVGHHANASHISCNLSAVSCGGEHGGDEEKAEISLHGYGGMMPTTLGNSLTTWGHGGHTHNQPW